MISMLGLVYKAKTASGTEISSAQRSIFFSTLGTLLQLGRRPNNGGLTYR